jgi:hypothetical protein
VILLLALLAGWLLGLGCACWQERLYRLPSLAFPWLAFLAFIPQLPAFYLPVTRACLPDALASAGLIASQPLLLVFAWLNRKLAGMRLLLIGLALNLAVILANGGWMPISPETAAQIVPPEMLRFTDMGSRLGSSKDVLMSPESTRLAWLADRFLLPQWAGYRAAFSLGDIFVAAGIFWLLLRQGLPPGVFDRFTFT